MKSVLTDIEGGIGRITLNRPDRMNAINVALGHALESAIDQLGDRQDVNVIVIRGAGGNFCAGGDFDEVQRLRAEGSAELRTLFTSFKAACEAITRAKVPVVAVVEGVAMAGGFELMQAADIVLVANEARIADNHINFGMIPGGGSTARLPRLLGRQQALGLLLSGDKITGSAAVDLGLAYKSFPADTFDESVEVFLAKLAGRDRSALTTVKRLVTDGLNKDFDIANADETDAVVWRIGGQAGQAGVSAFKNREVKA
ncbi:enoyl-CoA hydratase/isomerase family protein [Mycolicibacterium fluoranthenivorans]|uniref:Enoyl-CoA hydratase/carnithine racemase n=1 Tax=Mycolicibacterium fluoranthenivorans TaxID=258505 RepID=A0A7X5U375_9MYCO|nr:enoyl-CoA hydratase/isomerase family protein [Mycolicibacterium fluoranthenivorans]MCV7358569.1 enoyl-CoA hydratase/isomerase family protein [Mycolicibacterium fluoranthenivorans]NIH97599.1 enoyl-CoA hydratase/carnithine racemase [Mycolicibacterium fluoranthenivorans]